jgi:hypothetical protein
MRQASAYFTVETNAASLFIVFSFQTMNCDHQKFESTLLVGTTVLQLFSPCEHIMIHMPSHLNDIQGSLRNMHPSESAREPLSKMDPGSTVIIQPSFGDTHYQRSSPVRSTPRPITIPMHNAQQRMIDERNIPGHGSYIDPNIEGSRKHMLSHPSSQFEPPVSHRRINSKEKAVSIDQKTGRTRQHHRVDSGGLDMLSAAASVGLGKEEFDAVAYKQHPLSHAQMADPYRMHLPQLRHAGPHPMLPYAPVSHFAAYPMATGAPYFAGVPGRPMAPYAYPPSEGHPRMEERRASMEMMDRTAEARHPSTSNQVAAAMAVGSGENAHQPNPGAHHRKLSSISLSALFGPALFNGNEPPASMHPLKVGHHRATSSSISFLDSMGDVDDTFLRNLQAADADVATELGVSGPVAIRSDAKLATGGTSKRVRRKCSVEGCANRVVQGGLCITHGAKRKTCKHPGCDKNVKKAGLCSTHGPARKRCDAEGCDKVAVQGGKCISHGAKKRVCLFDNCSKQAILSGMCKKHHDKATAEKLDLASGALCKEIKPKSKRQHTRGLSIFQEISADTVQCILNDDDNEKEGNGTHNNW